MIESEYKCIIDSTLYQNIVNKLDLEYEGKRVVQINYYYDTEDLKLHQKGITFRIRQKDAKLSIEIKYPIEKKGLLSVKKEAAYQIDTVPKGIDINNYSVDSYLDGEQRIILIGMLVTERNSYRINSGIKVDVDKNYYYGVIDYELEIEFEVNFMEEAVKYLEGLTAGKYQVSQNGKRERFIYQLRKMEKLA